MKKLKIALSVISFILSVICFTIPAHSAERFVVKYDKTVDVTDGISRTGVSDFKVTVDMSRPAEPFKEIIFRIFVEKDGKPVNISHGYMLFNMSMDMGLYKAKLLKANSGYTAKIVLPKCIFGGTRWYGKLVFGAEGGENEKVYLFDMKE